VKTRELDEALTLAEDARKQGKPLSIGLVGNAVDVHQAILDKGFSIDIITDQTSAHDPLNGYVPQGYSLQEASALRNKDPKQYVKESQASMHKHVSLMLEFQKQGAVAFDYGNNIRQVAYNDGLKNAFDFPGFVPAYIRPLFCEGKGPFRFAALSGDPKDIERADEEMRKLFPENEKLIRWLDLAQEKIAFQGLPSRIAWLGYGERAQ
ncbi:urocanate hydratase, partial [Mesorhizobium sp. M8A.F.Ca.ET.173.01.1.1]